MLTNRRFWDHFHSLTKLGEGPWCISQKLKVVESQPNTASCIISTVMDGPHHRVHWVATATVWHTFYHDGKISPRRWGWGVHAHSLLLYLPSCKVVVYTPAERADQSPISTLSLYVLCGQTRLLLSCELQLLLISFTKQFCTIDLYHRNTVTHSRSIHYWSGSMPSLWCTLHSVSYLFRLSSL